MTWLVKELRYDNADAAFVVRYQKSAERLAELFVYEGFVGSDGQIQLQRKDSPLRPDPISRLADGSFDFDNAEEVLELDVTGSGCSDLFVQSDRYRHFCSLNDIEAYCNVLRECWNLGWSLLGADSGHYGIAKTYWSSTECDVFGHDDEPLKSNEVFCRQCGRITS